MCLKHVPILGLKPIKKNIFSFQAEKMIEEKDETIGQVSQDLASYRLRFISVLKEHNLKSTQLNRLKNDIEKALENVNDISIEEPNAPELNTSLDASTQVDLPHAELSPMESEVHIPDTAAEYNVSEPANQESIEEQPDTRLESALIMDSENTESSQNVLNQPSESYPDSSLSSNNESENSESGQNVLNQPSNPPHDSSISTYMESENTVSGQECSNQPSDHSRDTSLSSNNESDNTKPNKNNTNQATEDSNVLSLNGTESTDAEDGKICNSEEEVTNEMSTIETDSKPIEDEQITKSESVILNTLNVDMEPMSTFDGKAHAQLEPESCLVGQMDLVSTTGVTPGTLMETDVTAQTKVEDLNEQELGFEAETPENEGQNLPWMLS